MTMCYGTRLLPTTKRKVRLLRHSHPPTYSYYYFLRLNDVGRDVHSATKAAERQPKVLAWTGRLYTDEQVQLCVIRIKGSLLVIAIDLPIARSRRKSINNIKLGRVLNPHRRI